MKLFILIGGSIGFITGLILRIFIPSLYLLDLGSEWQTSKIIYSDPFYHSVTSGVFGGSGFVPVAFSIIGIGIGIVVYLISKMYKITAERHQ